MFVEYLVICCEYRAKAIALENEGKAGTPEYQHAITVALDAHAEWQKRIN